MQTGVQKLEDGYELDRIRTSSITPQCRLKGLGPKISEHLSPTNKQPVFSAAG